MVIANSAWTILAIENWLDLLRAIKNIRIRLVLHIESNARVALVGLAKTQRIPS